MRSRWLQCSAVVMLFVLLSCGGSGKSGTTPQAGAPTESGSQPATSADICNCSPSAPDSADYRDLAKHVGLPTATAQDITVAQILQWPTGPDPAPDAPRTGNELLMFHIPTAYAQFVWLVPNDCDIHIEISDTPDPNAPRMVVETPRDAPYCSTRQNEVAGLARYGVPVSTGGYNLAQPIPVEVIGLAFQDSNHERGTQKLATVWELHPAIVYIK
jgi:hypothetical protein